MMGLLSDTAPGCCGIFVPGNKVDRHDTLEFGKKKITKQDGGFGDS